MVCRKCGRKLKENEKFCTVCGFYNEDTNSNMTEEVVFGNRNENDDLLNDDNESFDGFSISNSARSSSAGNFEFKDDRYVEAYVGEDYKWVMRRPFNIYAFILSWLYFIYRKMYIIGIIGLAISGIIARLAPKALIVYIPLVMILSGVFFNPIYQTIVKLKVDRIKKNNDGTDEFELEKICKEKGGVGLKRALVIYLLFVIIMFFTYISISFNKSHNPNFWKENGENKANCVSLLKQAKEYFVEYSITGEIVETACLINEKPAVTFDLYYKLKDKNTVKYAYFKQHDKVIEFVNTTDNIQELELKKINNTITEEEKKTLEDKKLIESDYTRISINAKNEDKLIEQKKNYSQKLNYLIESDEIQR